MNLLRGLGSLVFGKQDDNLISITGELYYLDPSHPTNSRKLLCNGTLSIQRTDLPFQYHLIVIADDEDVDEQIFLIDPILMFNPLKSKFIWADVHDETQICGYEFVIGSTDQNASLFQETVFSCMFEREFNKSYQSVEEAELNEYIERMKELGSESQIGVWKKLENVDSPKKPTPMSVYNTPAKNAPMSLCNTPAKGNVICSFVGDLYRYMMEVNGYVNLESNVQASILQLDGYSFQLALYKNGSPLSSLNIHQSMNPVFYADTNSFAWVNQSTPSRPFSDLLRFKNENEGQVFHHTICQCLYESMHKAKFKDIKDDQKDYVFSAYEDVEMEDIKEEELEEEEDEEAEPVQHRANMGQSDEQVNKHLAVGLNHDRTFVVRGNKVGVFKNSDNDLEFVTAINSIKNLEGVEFDPSKIMLHQQDSSMLLMDPRNENSVYKLDLERGIVSEEWKVDDDFRVDEIAPIAKYSQRTNESVIIGMTNNSLFQIDPRVAGNKMVRESQKIYSARNKFSNVAATGKGELAVGSSKGEIRLFDAKLFDKSASAAKTLLAGLGDPIIGMDTTEDGRYVLATCQTYLLLIDTRVQGQEKSGFEKSISKHAKPKRLTLRPEHVAWMNCEVNFTPAKFNTGNGDERSIVTSTGKWIISWNFRQVKIGRLNSYIIKQYHDEVVADNFKFGQDKNIIVALQNDVEMISKSTLLTPTKLLKSNSNIVNSPY